MGVGMKNHYISKYLQLKCSGQLQELFSMSANPYKEITESMGAWINMREFIDPKDADYQYFFIGDGSLCLTSALFTFLTKGHCIAIDPKINIPKVENWAIREKVRKFIVFKDKYQDIVDKASVIKAKKAKYDLILVHAHVNLEELSGCFPEWRYLYSNPCCNLLDQTFSVQYQKENNISVVKAGYDSSIISPKNMVIIYKNNKLDVKDE